MQLTNNEDFRRRSDIKYKPIALNKIKIDKCACKLLH